jgi:hypothetical protein
VAGFFVRGRIRSMRLFIQNILPLANAEDSDSHPSYWWVVVGVLVIMALCWVFLSIMEKPKKTSLWQDEGSEMDSSSLGHD